jgi:hypothetical protein
MSKSDLDDLDLDVETELEHAFAELDAKIPDGYFESFSSKVAATLAATLETEASMQTRPNDANVTEEGASAPPIAARAEDNERDEHSGLHEIKELAQSARKRIARRSSESDVEASLLASSSSALSAVVLPDPEVETIPPEPIAVESRSPVGAAIAPRPSSGLPTWLWAAGGTGLIAAAIAVAMLVFGGEKDPDGTQVAATTPDESADSQAAPPPAEPEPDPAAAAAPSVAPLDDEAADDGEELEEDLSADADETDAEPAAPGRVRSVKNERGREAGKKERAKRAAVEKRKSDPDKDKNKAKPKEDEAEVKGATGGSEGGEIDDLLDQVAGNPEGANKQKAVEEKSVDKKRLDTGDVRRAMGGVTGAVKRCQGKTGFSGRVSIKFSVNPSGKVSGVKASGGNAQVHSCVVSAVKGARFPSFEPPAMSFRYSFLLDE